MAIRAPTGGTTCKRATFAGVLRVQVGGRVGIAADATSAVRSVTVVDADGGGFVTVYPCDPSPPLASNLNDGPGDVTTNSVVARLDDDGAVCL